MKQLQEYITESRTNPTAISTAVKKWIMELNENPKKYFEQASDVVNSMLIGVERGMHEFEKKADKNAEYEKAYRLLNNLKDQLVRILQTNE